MGQPYFDSGSEALGNDLWNALILDGIWWPGTATVKGNVERTVDVKPVKGQVGANYSDNGAPPAKVSISLLLTGDEEWAIFQAKLPSIHPRRPNAGKAPLQIEHPALAAMGVTHIFVTNIAVPEITDKGIAVSISAIEHVQAPKVVQPAKPKAPTKSFEEALKEDLARNVARANQDLLNSKRL